MTQWIILACFIGIAWSDYKRRVIPNVLLLIIVVLSFFGRTTIEIWDGVITGVIALLVGFVLYRTGQWSKGDIWLSGVAGLAFGVYFPYLILIVGMMLILSKWLLKTGLPLGVPVAVGAVLLTIFR